MPADTSSVTNGSSGRAGKTASVSRPADIAAREMFTPLPPACMVTESSRWTAPRSSGPARVTVRSLLGFGVSVTIIGDGAHTAITSTPARLDGPAVTGGDLLVGDEGVDVGQLGELDRALDADLAGVGEHDDATRALDDGALDGGLGAVGGGQAVLDGEAVGADEGEVGADRVERLDRLGPDRRVGVAADAAGQQVQLDLRRAGQLRRDRHRVGDHGHPQVGRAAGGSGARWCCRRRG